jgi:hypothetical protein
MKLHKILRLAWHWIFRTPASSLPAMMSCSSKTVAKYNKHFCQLIEQSISLIDTKIGGDGVLVEIDECKMGRRKYHRGHRVEGVWVLGGVERHNTENVFFVSVPDRTSETLVKHISDYALPGSIICTDMWKGYGLLNSMGYEHQHVNHSVHFKNPETGVHTNTIEGTWNGLKMQIKPRNRTRKFIDSELVVAIWRKKNKQSLWEAFMKCLKETHYELE